MSTLKITEPVLPHIIRHLDDIPEFLQDDKLKALKNETMGASATSGTATSIAVGVIFTAKPFCEFIANPFIGWAVDRYMFVNIDNEVTQADFGGMLDFETI